MNKPARIVLFFGVVLLLNATSYAASKLMVANNGLDSPTCGTPNNPCRSISRAIQNAVAGDTIIVGPGLYGDLNGNGTFTDAGDEAAEVGSGCQCMIKVAKQVNIFSRDGADVTVIDGATNNVTGVDIQASRVVFGGKGKGFTITRSYDGLITDFGASRVMVAGNRALGNNGSGFHCYGNTNLFIGNVAVDNVSIGFSFDGFGNQVIGNVAAANGAGFSVYDISAVLTRNLATANQYDGAYIATTNSVKGNSFIANRRTGIEVGLPTTAITQNNIFGNGQCGLKNDHMVFSVPGNFFGATTGPGPDPADATCGGAVTTTPFATKEIKVKVIAP